MEKSIGPEEEALKKADDKIEAWSAEKAGELGDSLKKQKIERLTDFIKSLEIKKQELEFRDINEKFKKPLADEIDKQIIKAQQELAEIN